MKMFRRISALVLCLVLLSATCIVASAEVLVNTSKKGSITIYTYESKKDDVDNKLDIDVAGDATGEEMEIPTGYIALAGVVYQLCYADGTAISDKTATTNAEGVATFADLEQGTY
ncbi:MAG: prealbumin-like fold domain-containing protein, partial [Acutalibacteraceae bacterium]|nr:prealbumin-like fold domain-containing protein [Acutalibacteraceae bacterium]